MATFFCFCFVREENPAGVLYRKCITCFFHLVTVDLCGNATYQIEPNQIFAEAGVMAIEHADFEGVERLAAVTGGATASTFDHPELAVLGECKKIEEVRRLAGLSGGCLNASRLPYKP